MVRVLVLCHVDRRHHVLDRARGFPEKAVRAIEQPTIARPSAFKHDFHLKPLSPATPELFFCFGRAKLEELPLTPSTSA
jgi:hypothetical protein